MMFQETTLPSSQNYFLVMDRDVFSLLHKGMIPPSYLQRSLKCWMVILNQHSPWLNKILPCVMHC